MCILCCEIWHQRRKQSLTTVLEKATTEMFIKITNDSYLGFIVFFLLAIFNSMMCCSFEAAIGAVCIGIPHSQPGSQPTWSHIQQAKPQLRFLYFPYQNNYAYYVLNTIQWYHCHLIFLASSVFGTSLASLSLFSLIVLSFKPHSTPKRWRFMMMGKVICEKCPRDQTDTGRIKCSNSALPSSKAHP